MNDISLTSFVRYLCAIYAIFLNWYNYASALVHKIYCTFATNLQHGLREVYVAN